MNKAIFLDRDGTVIKYSEYVTKEGQMVLEEGAADGIRLLNKACYKVIIVTNQPVIARGLVTEEREKELNDFLVKELKKEGAHIDAVYFCPHHPEKNHPDIPKHAMKYRIECECRKPKPGMLLSAAKDHNIDLVKSFMVGDETRDVAAGKNAGCKTILVKTGHGGADKKYDVKPDFVCGNLLDAAKLVRRNQTVKAVILAGGRGERLRPLTDSIPKPMIPIAGRPVLEHQINVLKKSGITEIVLCASYMVNKIKEYFGDGSRLGVKVYYPHEPEQLGSGGAVKNASDFLEDCNRFLVINGDKMFGEEFDFSRMLDYDREKGGFLTILVRETNHPVDSDILRLDKDSKVVEFVGRGQEKYTMSNSGVVIASPDLLNMIPEGKSNLEKDVTFRLIKERNVYAFVLPDNWFTRDMGTPERLKSVKEHFERSVS